MKMKECEVLLRFKVPSNKIEYIYDASRALAKLGISCDTGGTLRDPVNYDWEFDGSLKGPVSVDFKKVKETV